MAKKESQQDKTKGIILMAFGKRGYIFMAYNLAFTLKKFSPNLLIHVITDSEKNLFSQIGSNATIFDSISEVKKELLFTNGKFDPGRAKVNLYQMLPFDYNLYLDVDAICLKDINPLFDQLIKSGKNYISHTVGYHTIDKGRDFPQMQWAWMDDVWAHFKLDKNTIVPAINSSLQFIVKSDECEQLYATAKEWYETMPLPTKMLRMKWGGGQPDELYMNVSCGINKIDPSIEVDNENKHAESGFIHFAMRKGLEKADVIEKYYFQSYYGGRDFTNKFYTIWIDELLLKWHKQIGKNHNYTMSKLIGDKHANNR